MGERGGSGSTNGGRVMDERKKKKKKNFFFDDLSIFQEIFLHFLFSSLLSFPRFLFSTTMSDRHRCSFESLCVLANKFFDDFENLIWRGREGWGLGWGGCSIRELEDCARNESGISGRSTYAFGGGVRQD